MKLTRPQLMKHCKQFANGRNVVHLFRKAELAIGVYRESEGGGTYGRHGRLTAKRIIGGYVRKDLKQRRWVTRYAPSRPRGRPRNDANRFLISLLATAFAQATGKPVTLNREDTKPSQFEAFATPILRSAGVFDVRRIIANHMKARPK